MPTEQTFQYTHVEAGLVENVVVRRTDDTETYPSGWKYTLHLGTLEDLTLVGDIAINETGGLAHALGVVCRDGLDKLEAKGGEAADKVVVTPELNDSLLIVLALLVRLRFVNELQCVLTELFSVADGDVECRHECLVGRCGQ